MSNLAEKFVQDSVQYMRETYLQRIRVALAALPEDDLWWRPHDQVITMGTILLHLEGNVRQWIISGIGKEEDHRDRAEEFAATDGPVGPELFSRLERTVLRACDIIEKMGEQDLLGSYDIQGGDTTGMSAVYHVVEHFSWHVGQAVWIAKARGGKGHGISFFDNAKVNAARNRDA